MITLYLISHLYPAMVASITSVGYHNVRTKSGNVSSRTSGKIRETAVLIHQISLLINVNRVLRTYFFTVLQVTAQPFEMATSSIQSKEEQRLFVSSLTSTANVSTELVS